MSPLFTIGHSNHEMPRFIELLRAHRIAVVADVRSSPFSRWVPHFSKAPLEASLLQANIAYWFLGKELGALREEAACYVDGRASYALIAELPIFKEGIARVMEGLHHDRIALVCSEADPLTCHRAILVCRAILRNDPDLAIEHILPDASTESHNALQQRLVNIHQLRPELFGPASTPNGLIESAYDFQADRIAYRKTTKDSKS